MRLPEAIEAPHGWPESDENLMSNFDHEVNEVVAARMREAHLVARYPAWDFNACCWFSEGKYYAAVRVYRVLRATFAAETPQLLMNEVSIEFGWD
jgi:hypothetical protein